MAKLDPCFNVDDDKYVEALRKFTEQMLDTDLQMPVRLVHALASALLDARDQILRMQLVESVERIIDEELRESGDEIDYASRRIRVVRGL